jgi:excisionase family DNA binding protein
MTKRLRFRNTRTIYEWIKKGKLKAVKIERKWLIEEIEI